MATLNSQQYINIQCTTYKQIQYTIEQMESSAQEPKDFTCLMLVGFKIFSSQFILLILSKSLRKAFLKC
jgi:hypothetical protein